MILQALKEYYDRKAAGGNDDIAPPGWERKEIPFLIVLDKDGNPVNIEDTREGEGKKKRAKTFLVPQSVKRTVGIAANLLWDNPEYALGVVVKGKPKRVEEQHRAFVERIANSGISSVPAVTAVEKFLGNDSKIERLERFSECWEQIKTESPFISFRLAGETEPVFSGEVVKNALADTGSSETTGICLITGKAEEIERLHPAIKGVRGANTVGANIVGFNLDAFRSFGKEQGDNAPVGKSTSFAYTTALNTLLGKDSQQKMSVGDATVVFWAASEDEFENMMADFFSEPPKDDPDRLVEAVKSLYRSAETGVFITDTDKTLFYVLGLSPNAARISIRFWHCGAVAEMAGRFRQYFDELSMTHGPKDKDRLSLWRLLVAVAAQGKSENIPPNLAGDFMRAILEGLPYPQTLLQSVIRRIRAEHEITYPRAALIKATLNRSIRFNNSNQERELTVSLDPENSNIGYRLGCLFATLEKIQQEANPGINATIRDRFYGAASATPSTVFGNLMRLKNHHLSKLENVGRRVNLERQIGQIMDGIVDFPPHLALEDQGRFAIGYYHQMQDFFTKKSDKSE